MELSSYHFPTEILSGHKSIHHLPKFMKELNILNPLIVTDKVVAKLSLMENLNKIISSEKKSQMVFSEIWGNPTKSQVLNGVRSYKENQSDGIIAVGGGAAIDVAKAIAILVNHEGDLFEYEDKPGAKPIVNKIPPIISIPTTAGTGSEVGRSSVISDDHSKEKKILFSPSLLPQRVILDPELTLELPPSVTATTGMDALTHLIEAYLSKGHHPLCDGVALEGLKLVSRSFLPCYNYAKNKIGPEKEHLTARQEMLEAAMMGAVAFQKGLGVTHSCAHALSAICDLHHGLANAILLPYTLAFNLKGFEQRYIQMATALGLKTPTGLCLIKWIKELKAKLNIPVHLALAGINTSLLSSLVEASYKDGCHQCNPKPITKNDLVEIFNYAFGIKDFFEEKAFS